MLKKILLGMAAAVLLVVASVALTFMFTGPDGPPADSMSAGWLQPGPYGVGLAEMTFVDESRPTAANGDYPGAPSRTLSSAVWYPVGASGPYPLLVYSHGFMSNHNGGQYLAEALAQNGYMVVAPDFPLTHGNAPGGPQVADVVNQPGDVTFLIDRMLTLKGPDKPFTGEVDAHRIAVAGISLGGLTSTLVAFHPRMRDPRIAAAISIAGPAFMFQREFFAHASLPFLMIAGTLDAIVDFPANASTIPQRAPGARLVTVAGGSHLGFVAVSEPLMRFMTNPDELGCRAILASAERADGADPFAGLGGPQDGIGFEGSPPLLCNDMPLAESIHPGRQQMITRAAVLAFLQSIFGDPEQMTRARRVFMALADDFAEVSVSGPG